MGVVSFICPNVAFAQNESSDYTTLLSDLASLNSQNRKVAGSIGSNEGLWEDIKQESWDCVRFAHSDELPEKFRRVENAFLKSSARFRRDERQALNAYAKIERSAERIRRRDAAGASRSTAYLGELRRQIGQLKSVYSIRNSYNSEIVGFNASLQKMKSRCNDRGLVTRTIDQLIERFFAKKR